MSEQPIHCASPLPDIPIPGTVDIPGSADIPVGSSAEAPVGSSAEAPVGPRDWYSRGYLPHLDSPGLLQSINFRLHDALPHHVVERWKQELHWGEALAQDDRIAVVLRQRIRWE